MGAVAASAAVIARMPIAAAPRPRAPETGALGSRPAAGSAIGNRIER